MEALQPRVWPEEVIRFDSLGNAVIKEELTEDGQFFKIITKVNPQSWNQEDKSFEELTEYNYFESSYDRGYIGRQEEIDFIKSQGLILVQKAGNNNKTCSIGYQPETNKWWGWSHRARYGFTIGDIVKEGDCTASSGFIEEYAIQHPDECYNLPVGFKALTLKDAKRMAIAFAESVG